MTAAGVGAIAGAAGGPHAELAAAARPGGRRHLRARLARPPRVPRRAAVQAGARRLHGRHRGTHDRQPARQDHRHRRGGRVLLRGDLGYGDASGRAALADLCPGDGRPRCAARHGPMGEAVAGAAHRHAWRSGRRAGLRARRPGRCRGGRGPPGVAAVQPAPARRRGDRAAASGRHRSRCRGLQRQRAHGPRICAETSRDDRQQPGVRRPRRSQYRLEPGIGVPGQLER